MNNHGIDYGNEKLNEIFNNTWPNLGWAKQMSDKPFYRFFAVEYFATGEGVSYWFQISRNYTSPDHIDRELDKFKKLLGHQHYWAGIEELKQEEFTVKYNKMLPEYITHQIEKKDQPFFSWQSHIHINYS